MKIKYLSVSFLVVLVLVSGCVDNDTDTTTTSTTVITSTTSTTTTPTTTTTTTSSTTTLPTFDKENLRIATWNIQIFGKTKYNKPDVRAAIIDELKEYDIVAIQEIRDSSETYFPRLMEELPEYSYVVSTRLGRTSSKEQYAFIYRDGIQLIDSYVVEDPQDEFEREPFVGVFEVNNYSINLMQIHTKPDDAEEEIDRLLELRIAQKQIWLGDFNADCSYYDETQEEPYNWIIPDFEDTTVKATNCTYDRIVVTDEVVPLVRGYHINRLTEYNYSFQVQMSDHYPVDVVLDVSGTDAMVLTPTTTTTTIPTPTTTTTTIPTPTTTTTTIPTPITTTTITTPHIVINEIMYNPNQCSDHYCEWVELYNPTDSPVDVGGWHLSDTTTTDTLKGENTIIPSHGYAIITDLTTEVYSYFSVDQDAVRLTVDDDAIGSGLNNDLDTITLRSPQGIIDSVTYHSWQGADGNGYSLQRTDSGWVEGMATPGFRND